MIFLEAATCLILLTSFIFGAVKLWRKGKPLYFQIIVCAIGCCVLFNVAVITMSLCNVNETFFNTSFFGMLGCNMFLFCANRGALEMLFEKPKTKYLLISILAAVVEFALSFTVGFFIYGFANFAFYAYLLVQLPSCFVVFFVVKRLLSSNDELGLKKSLLWNDIFIILFCVFINLDVLSWSKIGILSGFEDLSIALAILGMSITAVRGAKKWSI